MFGTFGARNIALTVSFLTGSEVSTSNYYAKLNNQLEGMWTCLFPGGSSLKKRGRGGARRKSTFDTLKNTNTNTD